MEYEEFYNEPYWRWLLRMKRSGYMPQYLVDAWKSLTGFDPLETSEKAKRMNEEWEQLDALKRAVVALVAAASVLTGAGVWFSLTEYGSTGPYFALAILLFLAAWVVQFIRLNKKKTLTVISTESQVSAKHFRTAVRQLLDELELGETQLWKYKSNPSRLSKRLRLCLMNLAAAVVIQQAEDRMSDDKSPSARAEDLRGRFKRLHGIGLKLGLKIPKTHRSYYDAAKAAFS